MEEPKRTFWGTKVEVSWVTYDELSFLGDEFEPQDQGEHLKEDLLQVALPDGLVIDVGWLPEFDPNGAFQLTVVAGGDWERPRWQARAGGVVALKQALDAAVEAFGGQALRDPASPPDTRRLLHAYGLASDASDHLAALSGTDADAIAKAGNYLTSAIIHQGTPWPATGPIAGYVCSLVADGTLSAAARPAVGEFLDEVLAAVELAHREGGAEWLREQIASSSFDLDAAIAEMAELSDDDAEVAYEAMFEDDEAADLIMYVAFLGIVEREDELRAAQASLAALG